MNKISKLSREEKMRVSEIHKRAIIVDAANASSMDGIYFQKMQSSGVTATVAVAQINEGFRDSVKAVGEWHLKIHENHNKVTLAANAKDIKKAKDDGKVAMILGFHNAKAIENDLSFLRIFYELGVRIIQLTFNDRNLIGDGCAERTNCGLSFFGMEVVKEMNNIGMLIDLSHCSEATTMDALTLSKDPVVFSHSNARSLFDSPRNKSDEEIQALAEKGRVIGVVPSACFLSERALERLSVRDLLKHVDYIVRLVGVDYVGLGLAFSEGRDLRVFKEKYSKMYRYIGRKPKDIDTITKLSNITRGLVARGYLDEEIEKILGGNFLRIFEKVWK